MNSKDGGDNHTFISADRRGWHFDKGIPLATIVLVISTYTGLVAWAVQSLSALERRVQINEYVANETIQTRREILDRYDKRLDKYDYRLDKIEDSVEALKNKVRQKNE
jgi:hypothetical protein